MINSSNLTKDGSIQVVHSVLNEIKDQNEIKFHVVLSNSLNEQIDKAEFPANFDFYIYDKNKTIFNIFLGKDKYLDALEDRVKSDCVFTIFGPSYWKPKVPHLTGYALPHYLYP